MPKKRRIITAVDMDESDIIARLGRNRTAEGSGADPALQNSSHIWAPPRPAAVLIPLIRMPLDSGGSEWHILYTRRTSLVRHHKGQVSFPGGRSDPEDASSEATALREAFEEIGCHPSDVRILGRLDKFLTVSNHLITPFVGTIPWPYPCALNHHEVSHVFTIPIDWLADATHYGIHQREFPTDHPVPPQFLEDPRVIRFEPYQGEVVWGTTAEITLHLIERLELTPGSCR